MATENYPVPKDNTSSDSMTQAQLEAALKNFKGLYELNKSVNITSDFVIPDGVTLWMNAGSGLSVSAGVSVTVECGLTVNNGAVVTLFDGTKLVNNGKIEMNGGYLTAATETVMVNNGEIILNGSTILSVNGELQNNGFVRLKRGTMDMNGTYEAGADNSATNSAVGIVMYDWRRATLNGAEKIKNLYCETEVYSAWDLKQALIPQTCLFQDVYVGWNFELEEDLTIPEGVALNVCPMEENGPAVTLTVPEGVTLTNKGNLDVYNGQLIVEEGATLNNQNSIYVASGSTLNCAGTFTGNQPYGKGTIIGTSMSQDELEAALAEVVKNQDFDGYTLKENIILTRDLDATVSWENEEGFNCSGGFYVDDGVTLTVPSGVTLKLGVAYIFGTIDVQEGGKLELNGNCYVHNKVNCANVTYGNDGAAFVIDISENNTTITPAVEKSKLAATASVKNMTELKTMLAEKGYKTLSINIAENMAITEDITIAENQELFISYGKTLTINSGVTVTNYGSIYKGYNSTLVRNGTIQNYGYVDGGAQLYGVWLSWSEDGWYLDPEQHLQNFAGATAYTDGYVIFYAHVYNEETMLWEDIPVVPTPGSDKYTITRLVDMEGEDIKAGEEYAEYFVKVSSFSSLTGWQDTINFTVDGETQTNRFDFWDHAIATYTSATPSDETCVFSATMSDTIYLLPLNENYTITSATYDVDTWGEDYNEFCGGEKFLTVTELDNGGLKFTVNPKLAEYCKYDWKNFCVNYTVKYDVADDPDASGCEWSGGIWFNPSEDSMPDIKAIININGDYYNFFEDGMIARDYPNDNVDDNGEGGYYSREILKSMPEDLGATYDLTTNTLTLTNANLSSIWAGCWIDDEGKIWDMPSQNFTLKLVGENKLESSTTSPLNLNNLNLTIAGDGSLKVLAHNSTENDNAFSAIQIFRDEGLTDGGNLTIEGNAKVSICNDGEGHYYNEEDDTYFNADLHCIAGSMGTLTLKDSATLETRVPNGEYVFVDENGEGMRYNVINCMNILVQDSAILNTDSLFFFDGQTFTQNGGIVNIEAPVSRSAYDNEEGGMDVWSPCEGIFACNGSTININGGVMNIAQSEEAQGIGEFYGITITDEGVSGNGSTLNITGGTVNITSNSYFGLSVDVNTGSVMNMSGGELNLNNSCTLENNDTWFAIRGIDPRKTANGVVNLSGGTINASGAVFIFELNMTGGTFNLKNEEKINNTSNDMCRARMLLTNGAITGGQIKITNGTLINRNNFGMNGGTITINNTDMIEVTGLENLTYFPINAGTLNIHTNGFCAIVNNGTFHQMGGTVTLTADGEADVVYTDNAFLLNDGTMTINGYNGVHQNYNSEHEDELAEAGVTYAPVFQVSGGKLTINAEHIGIRNKGVLQVTQEEDRTATNVTIKVSGSEDDANAIVSEYFNWSGENENGEWPSDAKILLNAGNLTIDHNIQTAVLEVTDGKLTMTGKNTVKLDVASGYISGGEINITGGTLVNQMNFSIDGGQITIDNTKSSTAKAPTVGLVNNLYLPINDGTVTVKTKFAPAIQNNGTFHQMGGTVTAETTVSAAIVNFNCLLLNEGTLNLKGEHGIWATNEEGFTDLDYAVVQALGGELNINAVTRGIWGDLPIQLAHDNDLAQSARVNITVTGSNNRTAGIYTSNVLAIGEDVSLIINATGRGARGIWADHATVDVRDMPNVTITAKGETLYSENDSETDTGFALDGLELTNENYVPQYFTTQKNGNAGFIHKVTTSPVRIVNPENVEMITVNSWDELKNVMGDGWDEENNVGTLYRNVTIGKSFTIPADIQISCDEFVIPKGVTLTFGNQAYMYDNSHISVEKGGKLVLAKHGYLEVANNAVLDVAGTLTLGQITTVYCTDSAELNLTSGGTITIDWQAGLDVEGEAKLNLAKGASLTINKDGNLFIQDNAQLDVAAGATLTNNGYLHFNQNVGNPVDGIGYAHISGTYKQGRNAYIATNVHSLGSIVGIETKYMNLNAAVYPGGDDVLAMFLDLYENNDFVSGYVGFFDYTIREDLTIPKSVTMAGYGNGLTVAEGKTLTIEGMLVVESNDGEVPMCLYNYGKIVVEKGGILNVTSELHDEGTIINNGGQIYPAATKVAITKYSGEPDSYDIHETDIGGNPITAKLDVDLGNDLMNILENGVVWTSSNSKIVDANEIYYNGEYGCWIVPFAGIDVGKVTLTATANDGGKTSAKITLNTYFIGEGKLTAVLEYPYGGLQKDESIECKIYCGGKQVYPDYVELTPAKEGIVEISDVNMLKGLVNGNDSVKITATMPGDPLNRKVTFTVKTVPAQVTSLCFYENDQHVPGTEIYEKELATSDEVRTFNLYPTFAYFYPSGAKDRAPTSKSEIKWTTSDASVAKITANADGTATVTIPKNASGMAAITATANDSAKQQESLKIAVVDYTPVVGVTSMTLNSMNKASEVDLDIVARNGNKVVSAKIEDTRFSVTPFEYAYQDEWLVRIEGEDALKNETVKTKLILHTERVVNPGTDEEKTITGEYVYDLKITIKNSMPKVTVKQNDKFNLFYLNSEASITFTSEEYINKVEIVDEDTADFRIVNNGYGYSVTNTLTYSDSYINLIQNGGTKKLNSKITANVYLVGYREPVKVTFNVSSTTIKPTLTVNPGSSTFNTKVDDTSRGVWIPLYIYADGELLNLHDEARDLSVDSADGSHILLIEKDPVPYIGYEHFPTKTATKKITLRCANWNQALTVNYKVTVNKTVPTAKLSKTSLEMNNNYPSYEVATDLTCSEEVKDVIFEQDGTNFLLSYEDGKIKVAFHNRFNGQELITPKTGTYTIKATPCLRGEYELKPVTLTIKVVNTLPKVTLRNASLKLNSVFSEQKAVLEASATGTTNQSGVQVDGFWYGSYGEDTEFPTTAREGTSAYTEAQKIKLTCENGQLVASIRNPDDADMLPKNGTYSFKAKPIVRYGYGDRWRPDQEVTIQVKVESTVPTVKLSTNSITLNTYFLEEFSSDETAYITPTLTNNTSIPMEISGFDVKYADEEDEEALNIQFKKGKLEVSLSNAEEMKSKYTVKLYPVVEYAENKYETLTTPVTLTVNTYNKTPSVSLSSSGKLDTLNRATGITYTVTRLNNALGEISDVVLLDEDGTIMEDPHFYVALGEKNARGQQTITMELYDEEPYYVNATYLVRLGFYINEKLVPSDVLKIKVTQSNLNISVTSGTTQFYQSEGMLRFSLRITSPADAYFDEIYVNADKTSKELLEAMDFDGYYWWDFTETDYYVWVDCYSTNPFPHPEKLTAGKSYNLYLDVYPKNCAWDKPTTVKVTVKVNK